MHHRDNALAQAAFNTKRNDVKNLLRDLNLEVEMLRVFMPEHSLWDKAATLAEVEQYLRRALEVLRDDTPRNHPLEHPPD